MLDLASHYGEGPIMMHAIAERQNISRKYLDAIFASLKAAGLIVSRRGVGGGHALAKTPEQIRLGDVIRALEGPIELVDCVGAPALCARSSECLTKGIWAEVGKAIDVVLDHYTLADMILKRNMASVQNTTAVSKPF